MHDHTNDHKPVGKQALDKGTFKKAFQLGLEMAEAGHLRNEARYFGNILYGNEYVSKQIMGHGNIGFIIKPSLVMAKDERAKFLTYMNLLFPITFDVEPLRVKLLSCSNYEQAQIEYKAFVLLYKLHKSIDVKTAMEIKAAIENTYRDDWVHILARLVKWPTTNAPLGIQKLFPDGWQYTGLLSMSGYRVGEHASPVGNRRSVLSNLVESDRYLDALNGAQRAKWSSPKSLRRLLKLARTIAVLCRNAKGSPHNYAKAIMDWEADLKFLKKKYFYTFLHVDENLWPTTDLSPGEAERLSQLVG